jgi:hypothetical protein
MQGLYFYFVPFVFLLMCMPIQIVIITPLWEISVAGFAFWQHLTADQYFFTNLREEWQKESCLVLLPGMSLFLLSSAHEFRTL